jgi:fibronectin type 3 domain-containing protein
MDSFFLFARCHPSTVTPVARRTGLLASLNKFSLRQQLCCCLILSSWLSIPFHQASAAETAPLRSVILTWDPNPEPDIAGYRLRYGTSSGAYAQTLDVANTTTTTLTNLDRNTAYFMVVSAYNTAGLEGPPSDEATVLPNNADLAGISMSSGTLTPAFDSSIVTYSISVPNDIANLSLTPQPADSAASVTVNGAAVATGNPSPAIALLAGENTIILVVTAQNGRTTKTYSVTATREDPVPGSVTLSSQAPLWDPTVPPGSPAVPLAWTASSNATSYDLFRNGSLYLSGLTGTSYYDNSGLATGQNYSYQVVARNSSGLSQSNSIGVGPMPGPPPSPPGTFSLGSETPYWNNSANAPAVNLTWSGSADAASYDVYRNGTLRAGNLGAGKLSFLDDAGLAAGQTYTYLVTARNPAGSTQSNSLAVTMPGAPKVAARIISPAAGSTFSGANATFTWDAGTGVTQYSLWVGTGTGANASNLFSVTQSSLSRTVKGLPTDGRVLYVTLRSQIDGAWQSNVSVYTAYTRPKVLVLLHDLNTSPSASSPAGWEPLVAALQFPNSPIIYNGKTSTTASGSPRGILCYRVMFGRKDATTLRKGLEGIAPGSGTPPPSAFPGYYSGDFESLADLGSEVADAIACILSKHPLAEVVLLAHGRGGLAARSFLQSTTSAAAKSAVVALHTVGTPHSGTPLARFYEYLANHPRFNSNKTINTAEANNWAVVDALKEDMSHGMDLRRPTTSDLIPSGSVLGNLNSNLSRLPKISYASQIYTGTDLGWLTRVIKQTPIDYSMFAGTQDSLVPVKVTTQTASDYILGIGRKPSDYPGDGLVPAASQSLPTQGLASGISPKAFTYSKNIQHAEEPAQTSEIISVLTQTVTWWLAGP